MPSPPPRSLAPFPVWCVIRFGDALQPYTLGAQGNAPGGGGIIKLTARVCDINVALNSDGPNVPGNWNTGAGGSVWLTCTEELLGTGSVSASSSVGWTSHKTAGSGGRVAVYAGDMHAFRGGFTAYAGRHSVSGLPQAAPGTVLVREGPRLGNFTIANPDNGRTHLVTPIMQELPTLYALRVTNGVAKVLNNALVRTLFVTSEKTGYVEVDAWHGLVVLGGVCDAVSPNVNISGATPVMFRMLDGQPTSGSWGSGTELVGEFNAPWDAPHCMFGDITVAATVLPGSDCADQQLFSCAVPPNPDEQALVEVKFSPNGGLFHAFEPPFHFKMLPEVVCDVNGMQEFPENCTVDMLFNAVCDAACNVRACANDNRACPAPPVIVDVDGDDAADGTCPPCACCVLC